MVQAFLCGLAIEGWRLEENEWWRRWWRLKGLEGSRRGDGTELNTSWKLRYDDDIDDKSMEL